MFCFKNPTFDKRGFEVLPDTLTEEKTEWITPFMDHVQAEYSTQFDFLVLNFKLVKRQDCYLSKLKDKNSQNTQ